MKYSDKLSFLMYVNNYRTDDLAKQLHVKVNTLDTWLFFTDSLNERAYQKIDNVLVSNKYMVSTHSCKAPISYDAKIDLLCKTIPCSYLGIAEILGVLPQVIWDCVDRGYDIDNDVKNKIDMLLVQYHIENSISNVLDVAQTSAYRYLDNLTKLMYFYCGVQYTVTSKSLNDPIASMIKIDHTAYFKMMFKIAQQYFEVTHKGYQHALFALMRYGFIQLVSDPDIDDLFKLTDEWKNK